MELKPSPGYCNRRESDHYLPLPLSTASSPEIASPIAAPVIIPRTILGTDYEIIF